MLGSTPTPARSSCGHQEQKSARCTTGAAAALGWALAVAGCGDQLDSTLLAELDAPARVQGLDGVTTVTPALTPLDPAEVAPTAPDDSEALGELPLQAPGEPSSGEREANAVEPTAGAPGVETPGEEQAPPRVTVVTLEPVERAPVDCAALGNPLLDNPGALDDGDINVDLSVQFQRISGFGGMNMPRWIADLTPEQALTAFGDAPGQLGLSLLRIGVSPNPDDFIIEVPTAQRAVALGARVLASPWTPPPSLKSNGSNIGGELLPENYGAYADHLLQFRQVLEENGVPLQAISVQNEPDIAVSYDSCDWTPAQLGDFLREQGPRFGATRLMAAESFNFNRAVTDPLLNDPAVAAELDIVAGHIYGNGLFDYPQAREKGKEVWMTEHYTDSGSEPDRANRWPLAYNVATELHRSMLANFNAYVWWYIRRGYGLITDDGLVSKRGYLMSQFSRFIRPGYVRVAASDPAVENVDATAYANGTGSVVVVVLNQADVAQDVALDLFGSCVAGFDRFTTSEVKNAQSDGPVVLTGGRVEVQLDPRSVTTFVSQPIVSAAN